MKNAILNNLTSSANERKAFAAVWDMTRGKGKGYTLVFVSDFELYGLTAAFRRGQAIKRLIAKGLIFRHKESRQHWSRRDIPKGELFGYSVIESGCVQFLVGGLKCL